MKMVKISPKFQVVIPEQVRHALGIKAGMMVDVINHGGVAYLVPVLGLSELRSRLRKKLDSKNLRNKKDRTL